MSQNWQQRHILCLCSRMTKWNCVFMHHVFIFYFFHRNRLAYLAKSFKESIPMILLGFVRYLSLKGSGYHTHESEYGLHWNFFFTMAITKVSTGDRHVLTHFGQDLTQAWAAQTHFNIGGSAGLGRAHIRVLKWVQSVLKHVGLR